jgi:hypothetical protein
MNNALHFVLGVPVVDQLLVLRDLALINGGDLGGFLQRLCGRD